MLFLKIFPSGKRVCKRSPYGEGISLSMRPAFSTFKSTLVASLANEGRYFNRKDESHSGPRLLEIPNNYLFLAHPAPGGTFVALCDGAVTGRADITDALAFHNTQERTFRAFGHDKDHMVFRGG